MKALLTLLVLSAAPASPSISLEGPGLVRASYTAKALAAFTPVTADFTDKSGKHLVKGVRLDALLLAQGFTEGAMGPGTDPKVKHAGLRAALVATASDGFEAVFSVGELLPHVGATQALLVWELDGKPLPAQSGPFRLVVTTDKLPSRSLYQLVQLRLVDLSAPQPSGR